MHVTRCRLGGLCVQVQLLGQLDQLSRSSGAHMSQPWSLDADSSDLQAAGITSSQPLACRTLDGAGC